MIQKIRKNISNTLVIFFPLYIITFYSVYSILVHLGVSKAFLWTKILNLYL